MPSLLRLRFQRAALAAVMVTITAAEFAGAAPADYLPDNSVARLELSQPTEIVRNPIIAELIQWATSTRLLAPLYERPEIQSAEEAISFLETRLGIGREELVRRLTAGGAAAAVLPGPPPRAMVVFETEEQALPKKILETIDELVAMGGAEAAANFQSGDYHGRPYRRLGGIWIGVDATRILASGDPELLKAAVDRPARNSPPPAATGDAAFHVAFRVQTAALRKNPDMEKALEWPPRDVGAVAIFGGWFDLLRRFEWLAINVRGTADGLTLEARFEQPDGSPVTPGLEGFWAGESQAPLPLLNPPRTLYSASWCRDLSAMWQARSRILDAETLAKIDKADADAGVQMQVFGSTFTPSQLFSELGPYLRVVLVEGEAPYSEVTPSNVLPAGVAVIALKDEARVREWMGPVFRIFNLILNGDQGIVSTNERHGESELTSLSIPTRPEAQRKGSLDRYNFRTTYTFAHGSFVIGTTPAAVKSVIDSMGQERPAADADGLRITERQQLAAANFRAVLDRLDDALLRGFVLNAALTADEAREEIQKLKDFVGRLGSLEAVEGFEGPSFVYRIDWKAAK